MSDDLKHTTIIPAQPGNYTMSFDSEADDIEKANFHRKTVIAWQLKTYEGPIESPGKPGAYSHVEVTPITVDGLDPGYDFILEPNGHMSGHSIVYYSEADALEYVRGDAVAKRKRNQERPPA